MMKNGRLKTRVVEIQLTLPIEGSMRKDKICCVDKISDMNIYLCIKASVVEQTEKERVYKELAESAKKIMW